MENTTSWDSFLEEVLSSDSKHYLWLKSLSYLEYIGYRKMVKAVPYSEVHRGVFHHLSDEIQHSFMLKELAEKSFGRMNFPEEGLEGLRQIAESYFQGIDSKIHDWVVEKTGDENPYLCYMAVSYIIEKRAMRVYPQYYAGLKTSPLKIVVQKIIKDESEHLSYLEGMMSRLPVSFSLKDPSLMETEEEGFLKFVQELKRCFDQIGPVSFSRSVQGEKAAVF